MGAAFFEGPWGDEAKLKHIKAEKIKARELRASRWWKTLIASASCYYCEKKLAPSEVTMDHRVPLSRGGRSTKGNVVAACKTCNNQKKNLTPVEWDAYLQGELKANAE